jgi:hypothetical protein
MKIFGWLYLGSIGLLLAVVVWKAIEEIKIRLCGWKPEREVRQQKIGGYRPRGCPEGEAGVSPRSGQSNGIF